MLPLPDRNIGIDIGRGEYPKYCCEPPQILRYFTVVNSLTHGVNVWYTLRTGPQALAWGY